MRVLITGGNKGIGLALADVFREHGHTVISVGRSGGDIVADLREGIARICVLSGHVDILVNNAAEVFFGDGTVDHQEIIDTNVLAAYKLSCYYARQGAKILNVISVNAYGPQPFKAVYSATKAFLLSYSLSLRDEGYWVTCLCPGPTRTAMLGKGIKNTNRILSAREVAIAGYNGLMKNKAVVIPGWWNKLVVYIVRHIPDYRNRIKRQTIETLKKEHIWFKHSNG